MAVLVTGGTVGIGKSTVAAKIAKHLGSEVFFESVDDNPILEKFYPNKKRWAFALQIFFLNTRFKSIKKALKNRHNVLDRSIYEDALFATLNYEEGNMSKEELDCYMSLLDNMMEELNSMEKKSPDLFIYLRGSFEIVLHRMELRGRGFELENPENYEYFKRLHSRYDDWVFNHYKASDILIIDMDKYDIHNPEHEKIILTQLDLKLSSMGQR
jgi:deoxyadenosine/deoxycytidine kinase